jgi:peptidoglycan/xylan/chitin deacetylase (PgdA/CDA1 family)
MPWKDDYTVSDERSINDADVRWPNDAGACLHVVVDLSPRSGPEGIDVNDVRNDQALFGLGEGLENVRRLLSQHQIQATFAVPGVMGKLLAGTLRELVREGHEIAAHGFKHEDVSELVRDEEERRITHTTQMLADVVGGRPRGWFSLPRHGDPFAVGTVSANTIDLLIDAGYQYFGNGLADDVPYYWVSNADEPRCLLTMPYYYHFDDQFFLMFPDRGAGLEHADTLYTNWVAEFDAQYQRGRFFSMTLHPFAIGFGHRLKLLDTFFEHVRSRPGVWSATGGSIAEHWLTNYPAETHLKLEPSVWQDYPDSLS